MPQPCSICGHPQRLLINHQLVSAVPNRRIATQFGVSESALRRHKATHLPASLVQAVEQEQLGNAIDVLAELRRCFNRINLLFDACDRWLRDPLQPDLYTLDPRADELDIIYTEPGPRGGLIRKKESLAVLLAQLAGTNITHWETKHADPRELVLKTAAQLSNQLELVANLIDRQTMLARIEALEARAAERTRR